MIAKTYKAKQRIKRDNSSLTEQFKNPREKKANQIWWLLILFAVASRLFIHWNEDYGFRQTQTALTAYWFVKDGINLFYPQLPVFGPSSTFLPFEFPLFQAIVATIAIVLKLSTAEPIIVIGRLVNFSFFLACAVVLFKIAEKEFSPAVARIASLLWLTIPFNFYWSSESLIEFCAVFWTLLYAYKLLNYSRNFQTSALESISVILFGSLAFSIKITTAICLVPSLVILIASTILPEIKKFNKNNYHATLYRILAMSLKLAIPFLFGYAWIVWSDFLKKQNTIAGFRLTSSALRSWNFGDLAQRLDINTWEQIGHYLGYEILAYAGIPLALIGLFFVLKNFRQFLWILPIPLAVLVFTNLYYVHSYYFVAITPYVVLLVAMGVDKLISWFKLSADYLEFISPIATVALTILMWSVLFKIERPVEVANYGLTPYCVFYPLIHNAPAPFKDLLAIASVIKANSQPNDWILVVGDDWSSEIPFYSERKALMLPGWLYKNSNKLAPASIKNGTDIWTQLHQIPIKLFVQLSLPYSQLCPYLAPDTSSIIGQTKTFCISKGYKLKEYAHALGSLK